MGGVGSRIQKYSDVISFPAAKAATGGTVTYKSADLHPFDGGSWDKAVVHMIWTGDTKITDTVTVKPYVCWTYTGDSEGDTWVQIGSYGEFATSAPAGDTYHVISFCPRLRIDVVCDATAVLTTAHGASIDVEFYEKDPERRRRFGYNCVDFGDTYASFGDTIAYMIGDVGLADGRGWGDGDTGDSGHQSFVLEVGDTTPLITLIGDCLSGDSIVVHINELLTDVEITTVEAYLSGDSFIALRTTAAGEGQWFSLGDSQDGDSSALVTFGWGDPGDTYAGDHFVAKTDTTLVTGINGDTVDLVKSSTVHLYAGCVDRSKINDTIEVKIEHSEDALNWRTLETAAKPQISNGTGPIVVRETIGEGDTTGVYRYVRAVVSSTTGDSNATIEDGHGCHVHIVGIEK